MKNTPSALLSLLILIAAPFALSACGLTKNSEAKYPTGANRDGTDANDIYSKKQSIFGKDGLVFGGKRDNEGAEGVGITVNSFLWRASLDTVSFMPLSSADPFGGVILTDWYSPDGVENERFKLNVFILTRQLRSDGIQVRVFKQEFKNGQWHDIQASGETARQLEDTILTRARQLRVSQVN